MGRPLFNRTPPHPTQQKGRNEVDCGADDALTRPAGARDTGKESKEVHVCRAEEARVHVRTVPRGGGCHPRQAGRGAPHVNRDVRVPDGRRRRVRGAPVCPIRSQDLLDSGGPVQRSVYGRKRARDPRGWVLRVCQPQRGRLVLKHPDGSPGEGRPAPRMLRPDRKVRRLARRVPPRLVRHPARHCKQALCRVVPRLLKKTYLPGSCLRTCVCVCACSLTCIKRRFLSPQTRMTSCPLIMTRSSSWSSNSSA